MVKNEKNVKHVIKRIANSDGFNDFMKFCHNIDAAFLTFFKFIALIFGMTFNHKKNENQENTHKFHENELDGFCPYSIIILSVFSRLIANITRVSPSRNNSIFALG